MKEELGLHLAEDYAQAMDLGYGFVWRSAKYLEDPDE